MQAAAVASAGVYSTGGLGPGQGEERSAGQTITSEWHRGTHGSQWSQVVTVVRTVQISTDSSYIVFHCDRGLVTSVIKPRRHPGRG